jgi:crossover junction endodeoxyribonuclease RuvC
MIVLGIDPGVKGALALYDTQERRVTTHDMPDTTASLYDLISALPKIDVCVVEKPFYPKMIGVQNVARIAEAYGRIKAVLFGRGIAVREVRPAEWKAALGLSSSKSASRELAGCCFPDDADQWARVRDDGRAEAALLAWFGLRWAK